jgi:hypothetical protein
VSASRSRSRSALEAALGTASRARSSSSALGLDQSSYCSFSVNASPREGDVEVDAPEVVLAGAADLDRLRGAGLRASDHRDPDTRGKRWGGAMCGGGRRDSR